MHNKITFVCLRVIIVPFLFGCQGPVKKENKKKASASSVSYHAGDERYAVVDRKESVVTWKGSNSFGIHTGYVYLSKGELLVENGELVGGSVEVDMNTIEDESHRNDNGLIKHLKDPDFFDVKKNPFSTIAITGVAPLDGENKKVTGDLTIKGITHAVSFPAKVEVKAGVVKASGKLVIDRTAWGISYNSGKFFSLLADKAISDSIEFKITIVANK